MHLPLSIYCKQLVVPFDILHLNDDVQLPPSALYALYMCFIIFLNTRSCHYFIAYHIFIYNHSLLKPIQMPKLKDSFAFSITVLLIVVPSSILIQNQLISTTLTPPSHCLPISNPTASLCVYCLTKKQSSVREDAVVEVEDDQQFKVLEVDSQSALDCPQLMQLIDYDQNIQRTEDIQLERRLVEEMDGQIKFEFIEAAQKTYQVQKNIMTFLIARLKNQPEDSTLKVKYPSLLGIKAIHRLISIEALAAIFTVIIYSIIRMARGSNFRKEIFVNLTILGMVLASLIFEDSAYLLGYSRCLYIALCLCMINTEKIFILLPMFLMVFNNGLLSSVGFVLTLIIFAFQFMLKPKFTNSINYIGSCLLILTANFFLMEWQPHLMNDYPLQIVEYSTICTSTLLMEMLESQFKAKPQTQGKTGPSLTGFEEITNEDEDF